MSQDVMRVKGCNVVREIERVPEAADGGWKKALWGRGAGFDRGGASKGVVMKLDSNI